MRRAARSLVLLALLRRPPPRARPATRLRGRRSTSATRPSSRTRSASAPRCPARPRARGCSMRFRVQYQRRADDVGGRRRTPTPAGGRVGTAKGAPVESGWSFKFAHAAGPGDAARRRQVPLAQGRQRCPRSARGRHRGRAPLERRRRPAGLLRRHLRARQLSEQPRVVGDDPGDAQLLQAADARGRRRRSTRRARRRPRGPPARAAARRAASAPSARRSGPPAMCALAADGQLRRARRRRAA